MPGWLRRAAAWASRSTRLPRLATLLDRLDRDGALEPAVPGLVDDTEPAAADAALDQKAVKYQGADQSPSPTPPPSCATWIPKPEVCGRS